jgi:hypothetical protein
MSRKLLAALALVKARVRMTRARRPRMGSQPGLLVAAVLICFGMSRCGGTGSTSRGAHNSATTGINSVLDFGHAASQTDRRTVMALIKRYYTAAAAGDGKAACSLILPSVARSVPEDYGHAPGPMYLRGGQTCPEVVSRMFAHLHRRLTADAATLQVTHVRLKTTGGYAVMRFGASGEHEIPIVRDGIAWYVSSLIDDPLP